MRPCFLFLLMLPMTAAMARQDWFAPYHSRPAREVDIVVVEQTVEQTAPVTAMPSVSEEVVPLESELFAIRYAKASDIAAILDHQRQVGMVSQAGSIAVDERTNALLVHDRRENLDRIATVIDALDIPVRQVQIEARIVTVNEGEAEALGVRWGLLKAETDYTIAPSIEAIEGSTDLSDRLNVNLGVANPNATSVALQLAKLGSDTLLDLELSALQAESRAEIISSPRLVTTNKQPAYIEQGSEIPYLEAASSGATSVSFRKAVLSLKVIPQITPDNRLVLDLSVTQDRPGEVVKTGIGESVAIDTQRLGTQVLVDNGETLVLGGIHQKSIIRNVEKVPYLADIPWLGRFFRRDSEKVGRSELLIFVTPTILFSDQ